MKIKNILELNNKNITLGELQELEESKNVKKVEFNFKSSDNNEWYLISLKNKKEIQVYIN